MHHLRRLRPPSSHHLLHCGAEGIARLDGRERREGPEAAGVIHTDFERGFIRAEPSPSTISSPAAARRRQDAPEGKDYVVQDGDIMLFRFNV